MLRRLIVEIHRRSLWQVLAIFLATGWGVLQVLDILIQHGVLPAWVFKAGLVLLLIGLPIVMATAFVQEGLPGGSSESPDPPAGRVPADATAGVAAGTGSLDLPSSRAPRHHRLFTWRNAILGGVAAFTLLGVVAAGYVGMRVLGLAPGTLLAQGVLEKGAPVILADFESPSDPELGGVVTRALRVDLLQSAAIRIVEREDLSDAMGRMQLEDGTPLTAGVARQLAEREGYAAVIAGEVASAGSGYVLTASILGGDGYRPLAGFRETARSDDELVDAIERLSRAMRDKVGESLRAVRGGPSLSQVTTASLPALRAYTRAESLERAGDFRAALEQYERAATLDSTFAMAYRKIAGTLLNQGVRRPDAVRAARRAYELRERLPELERHLATGLFHDRVSGDIEGAAAAYEQAVLIDSSNASARNSLANVYAIKGRYSEAEELYVGPLRTSPIAALWANLARTRYRMGGYAPAAATLDSARVALPDWGNSYHLQVVGAAAQGDLETADSLIRELETRARTPLERENARLDRYLLAASRGRLREAERIRTAAGAELFLAEPVRLAADVALLRLQRGDTAGAIKLALDAAAGRRDADELSDAIRLIHVLIQARAATAAAGLLSTWESAAPVHELGVLGRINREAVAASLARIRGDFAAAIAALEALRNRCPGCGSYLTVELARAFDESGQADRALAEYEHALQRHDPDRGMDPFELPHALRRLGELYDARGDTDRAVEHYARFLDLWKDPDPELQPQVRRVRDRVAALVARRG